MHSIFGLIDQVSITRFTNNFNSNSGIRELYANPTLDALYHSEIIFRLISLMIELMIRHIKLMEIEEFQINARFLSPPNQIMHKLIKVIKMITNMRATHGLDDKVFMRFLAVLKCFC